MKPRLMACALGLRALTAPLLPAQAEEFPSLRRQFQDLPCLAPVIAKISEREPKTLGEALSLPPNEAPTFLEPSAYGKVRFPITSSTEDSESLQPWFNQGIGLIHLGSLLEAERCFRQVIALDPDCPMGYWGLMLANEGYSRRAELYLERAMHLATKVAITPREKRWIRAYIEKFDPTGTPYSSLDAPAQLARQQALERSLETLAFDVGDAIEATAFLLRAHWQRLALTQTAPDLAYGVQLMAEKIERMRPGHPAQGYLAEIWRHFRPRSADRAAATMLGRESLNPVLTCAPAMRSPLPGSTRKVWQRARLACVSYTGALPIAETRLSTTPPTPRSCGNTCERLVAWDASMRVSIGWQC